MISRNHRLHSERSAFAASAILGLMMLTACNGYPRDFEGTMDRISEQQVIRVGIIAGSMTPDSLALTQQFLDRLAQTTGAQVRTKTEAMEPALADLERGSLDMAIGEVATDSPWQLEAAVIEPLAIRRVGDRKLGLSAIARNGENRWIMVLERETRNLGTRP